MDILDNIIIWISENKIWFFSGVGLVPISIVIALFSISRKKSSKTKIKRSKNVNIINGIGYYDVKNIALDIFKQNIPDFISIAKETAAKRAEEIVDNLLKKLFSTSPQSAELFSQPLYQHSLFLIQKEYSLSGDKELMDLLTESIIEMVISNKKPLLQIIITESLKIIPILNKVQLNILSTLFLIRNRIHNNFKNLKELNTYFEIFLKPYFPEFDLKEIDYKHLMYSKCIYQLTSTEPLEDIFYNNYGSFFCEGFQKDEIKDFPQYLKEIVIECENSPNTFRFDVLNESKFASLLKENNESTTSFKLKTKFFRNHTMGYGSLADCVENNISCLSNIFNQWTNNWIKNINLTSVGIFLAFINIKKDHGDFIDISKWVV